MNKLSHDKQKLVLNHLAEGSSIRSIQRITGVDQNTIMKLLVKTGAYAHLELNANIHRVPCNRIEIDEIWTFVGIKRDHLPIDERDGERGDKYVFIALDAETKLIPHFLVGKRDDRTTRRFIFELRHRIRNNHVQFSTDGYGGYRYAIADAFPQADYAQVIKHYVGEGEIERRYSPAKVTYVKKRVYQGNPEMDLVSTSYVERQNLTLRMSCRRFARLTNAFSKKLENLVAACNLYVYHYNFMRIHETLRMTPAMAAGITGKIWDWEPLLD